MRLKELQLLSESLWESVKLNLKFFSPIQVFVKKLAEIDFSKKENLKDMSLYIKKIEEFFDRYRPIPDIFYIPPIETSSNDNNVKRIQELINDLQDLSPYEWNEELESIGFSDLKQKGANEINNSINELNKKIFIGHGGNKLWSRVKLYLQEELNLETVSYESESRTSENIINILESLLDSSSFAILIMTAEDSTVEGKTRARQNVIHEAGLFQGRLGFNNVIILKQNGTEEFSNISGLQYIPFSDDNIEHCFYDLHRKLKKYGLIK